VHVYVLDIGASYYAEHEFIAMSLQCKILWDKFKIAPMTREKETPCQNKNQNRFLAYNEKKTSFKIVNMHIQIDLHKTQRIF